MLRTILVVSVLLVASPSAYSQSLVSIYQQNFNSGGGGWTSASTPLVPSNNQPWATGPTGVGGTGAWTTSGLEDGGSPFFQTLTSPVINVPYTAQTRFSFDHSHNFEFDGTVWDGGVVMVSVNGSPFTQIPDSAFTANSYNEQLQNFAAWGIADSLNGADVFGRSSAGFISSIVDLGPLSAGNTIQLQFRGGFDWLTSNQLV